MLLADPAHTRLEIRLPVQDAMALPEDARILFFSAAVPHRPFEARLAFSSYRASMDERSALSYRLEGVWKEAADAENMPRLGSVGNAKIYGPWRPLIWQLLRRPLTAARGYIGF
jgi:hypothetical protein